MRRKRLRQTRAPAETSSHQPAHMRTTSQESVWSAEEEPLVAAAANRLQRTIGNQAVGRLGGERYLEPGQSAGLGTSSSASLQAILRHSAAVAKQALKGPGTAIQRNDGGGQLSSPAIIQRAAFRSAGSSVIYVHDKTDAEMEMSGQYKSIEIDGMQVWVNKNSKRVTIQKLKRNYNKEKLNRVALKARMRFFKQEAESEEIDSFDRDEYRDVIFEGKLGFGGPEEEAGKAGMPAQGNDVYAEFSHAGLKHPPPGQSKVDFKTGFSSDLGAAVIRNAFREGVGKEFFASDVFLVHLQQAAERWDQGDEGANKLASFPPEIYIPEILNNETDEAAKEILSQSASISWIRSQLGVSMVKITKGAKYWDLITGTPLVKLVMRVVQGYNLLTSEEGSGRKAVEIDTVRVYSNKGLSKLPSLYIAIKEK